MTDKYEITPDDEEFLDKLLESEKIKGKLDTWLTSKLEAFKASQTPPTPSNNPADNPNNPQNDLGAALASLARMAPLLEKLTQASSPPPAPENPPKSKSPGATVEKPASTPEAKKSLFR